MLKRIYSLTVVFLKSSFHTGTGKSKKKWTRILLYGLLYVYVMGVIGFGSYYLVDLLSSARQAKAFVTLVVLANIMLTLFTTLIASLNMLYFSEDNAALLPMPIRPMELVSARLNSLLIYEYLEAVLLGVIPLGVYAVMTGQPWYFYLIALLVLFFLPILPAMISSLLIMALMSFTGKVRNKKAVQAVTTVISLVFVMGFSFWINSGNQDTMIIDLIRPNGLATVLGRYFPTASLAADALNRFDMLSLILLGLVSILSYVLMILFSQKLYYKGMVGSLFSSSGVSKKKINEQTAYRSRGIAAAYIGKEIRTYIRKPIYLVQLVLPCLIVPVFLAFTFYFSFNKAMAEEGMNMAEALRTILMDPEMRQYFFYGGLIAMFFSAMYSFLSSVAISKDGHDAAFMKTIPVPFYKQLIYKAVPDILMTLIIYLVVALLMGLLFGFPLSLLLPMAAVCIPFAFLHGGILLFDLKSPKLEWNNEMEVVKNNMRTLIPIGFSMGNLILIGLAGFLLHMSIPVMTAVFGLGYTALTVLLYLYIRRKDIQLADHIS
ncbi:MAG: hypothetical protein IKG46_01340 [Solobacterium sp.]|nr:hypothetical protein [Solobacterium sp.]